MDTGQSNFSDPSDFCFLQMVHHNDRTDLKVDQRKVGYPNALNVKSQLISLKVNVAIADFVQTSERLRS